MNPILAAGLLIGVLCGVWTFVMGLTGWYKDPAMVNVFFVVILIQIGGLVWGLRKTEAQGRTYSGQVVAGTLMSIVAGLVIIVSSLLFTSLAYPDYFTEVAAAQRKMLEAAGRSPSEIEDQLRAASAMQTPTANALMGFLGTFVTGVVASAIISIWIRARGPRVSPARR